jgi:pyruvate,water dikinase
LGKKFLDSYDGNIKRIFDELDMKEYVQGPTPASSRGLKWGFIKMTFKVLPSSLKSIFSNYYKVLDEYNQTADEIMKKADSLSANDDILETTNKAMTDVSFIMNSVGVIVIGMLKMKKFRKMFKGQDIEADIINLCMDLDGNVTSEMGYQMFRLASYDELKNTSSPEEFVFKINKNAYSDEFMNDYNDYIKRFGARGFMEIDVATKRTWEDVSIIYDKLKEINTEDSQITKVKEKRKAAYERLLALAKDKGFEKKFVKAATAMQETFGYREHPKYVIVYVLGKLHNVMLEVGEEFVKTGRLKNSYQIFDLHLDEIAQARKDSSVDIMKLRDANLVPYKATDYVKDWPLVMDSRGKTFKPKIQVKDGELSGDPIASGKVTGRAKVLHSPYEKPLHPGEILITKATEPSWTPIFINAAGVVMEIGGPLQHGAIIAREYGIPCVSALMGAMEIIKDGDFLEVDGTNGSVKIIKE